MPQYGEILSGTPDIKVFIQNPEGKYLAGEPSNWFFTEDRSLAIVFNYQADHVPEQLDIIRRTYGIELLVDPVPLEEIYETCDRCKELFMPVMTFFDGKLFLCPDCRKRVSARARRA